VTDELWNEGQWEREARMVLYSLLKEAADEIEYRDKRIEDLEAALRRISHAPHGKVFNAHGHEEAYLIACKALEEKDGLATNANKKMFKWINAQSHWKPDEDLYTVVLMKPDGLPETNLTYSFERAWEYATNYKEEVMYFLKQVKESE
jgi:hypothetical protein